MTSSLPRLLIVREILYGLGILVTMGVGMNLDRISKEYLPYGLAAIAILCVLQILIHAVIKPLMTESIASKGKFRSIMNGVGVLCNYTYAGGLMFLGVFITQIDAALFLGSVVALFGLDMFGLRLQQIGSNSQPKCAEGTT